jgi:hypothetical protein
MGQVAPVSYHTFWPLGNDPFYVFKPQPVQAKVSYYHVPWLPFFMVDGQFIDDVGDFSTWLRATLDSMLTIDSPVRINLEQYPSQDWDSVYVSFDVVAVGSIAGAAPRVYLAVTEEYHEYPDPVGGWRYAFRDFIPGSSGYAVTLEMGDSLHFDWKYPVNSAYDPDAVVTNIFVQDYTTKLVFQAKSARVAELASVAPGDTPGGTTARTWLGQNAPNPFTGETTIAYMLDRAGRVRLSVYAPTGRLVANLVDGYVQPGSYAATWSGQDRFGREVGSGVYYYCLETANGSRSGRMVILK